MNKLVCIISIVFSVISISYAQTENPLNGTWGHVGSEEGCETIDDYLECLEEYREFIIDDKSLSHYLPILDTLYSGYPIKSYVNGVMEVYDPKIDSTIDFHYTVVNKDLVVLSTPTQPETLRMAPLDSVKKN